MYVLSSSSTAQQQDMETEDADDEDAAESQTDSSDDDDKDGHEAIDGGDDWKPDPELQSPKTRRKRGTRASAAEGKLMRSSKFPCKICGVWYRILGSLIKHAWSHMEEPQCVCGVCGEHFKSVKQCVDIPYLYIRGLTCDGQGSSSMSRSARIR